MPRLRRAGLRPAALALLAALLLSPGAAPRAAISVQDFLASPAAAAFKAGDYEAARAGFEALLAEEPEDPLILRYLGITYDRLGRLDEAVATFERALAVAPDNAAVNFFLGVAHWKARRPEAARRALERVIALAPGSAYEEKAQAYLEAMTRQRAQNDAVGAPRRWQLRLGGGVQHDDNVALASDDFETRDFRFYQTATAAYRLYDRDGLRLEAGGFAYLSQHAKRDNHDFNVALGEPSLELAYATTLWALPASAKLRYAFNFTALDGSFFSNTHDVEPSFALRPHPQALTRVYNRISVESFDDKGFSAKISSRNGVTNRTGVTQYLFCCRQAHYLFGGYEFLNKFAEGDNFDRFGHRFTLGASASLPYAFRFDVQGEYAHEDYFNFVSTKDRRSDRFGVSASLTRPLIEGLTVSVSFAFTDEDSNFEALDYGRKIFGANIAYRF